MKLAAYSQVGRGDIMQRGFQGACSTRNAPLTEHHGDTNGAWAQRGSQESVQSFDRRPSHLLGVSCAQHGRAAPP